MLIIVVFYVGQWRLVDSNVQGTLTNKLRAQNLMSECVHKVKQTSHLTDMNVLETHMLNF